MPLDEVKQSADKRDSGTESETHFIRYTVNADIYADISAMAAFQSV